MINTNTLRFYHSFPRRKNADPLKILAMIARSGLLLTPEIVRWPSGDFENLQVRSSFTCLQEDELARHARVFGDFSIELAAEAFPFLSVAYLPPQAHPIGRALADIQRVLERIENTRVRMGELPATKPIGVVDVQTEEPLKIIGATASQVAHVLHFLAPNSTELLAYMKGFAQLLYPSHNSRVSEPHAYYQQREWRIVADLLPEGWTSVAPDPAELGALLSIDNDFFAASTARHSVFAPATLQSIGEESRFLRRRNDGGSILSIARRLICPASEREHAHAILRTAKLDLDVISLEELGEHGRRDTGAGPEPAAETVLRPS
jgi:hypothetical protein